MRNFLPSTSHTVQVKLSLCLTKHYAMKTHGGVVGFMPLPLYSQGKIPSYALESRLGRTQTWSGQYIEAKILNPTGT
jgi:hypothetical protein